MLNRPDPIVTPGSDRLRRNRLAVSDSSDQDDQSKYGSVVKSNHGLAPSEVDFHSFGEREEEVNIYNEEQLEAQQNDQNPNSSAPMESDGANPVEDSLESDPDGEYRHPGRQWRQAKREHGRGRC